MPRVRVAASSAAAPWTYPDPLEMLKNSRLPSIPVRRDETHTVFQPLLHVLIEGLEVYLRAVLLAELFQRLMRNAPVPAFQRSGRHPTVHGLWTHAQVSGQLLLRVVILNPGAFTQHRESPPHRSLASM